MLAHGDVLSDHAGVALPNPPAVKSYGPFPVPHATAVRLLCVPTGGSVTVTANWTMDGTANAGAGATQVIFAAAATQPALLLTQGHLVSFDLLGSVNGVTADFWAVAANPTPFSGPPAALGSAAVTRVAALNIPNAVTTAVAYDTLSWDNAGIVNLATFPTRLTAPLDGYYNIGAFVSWAVSAVGERIILIQTTGPLTGVRHIVDARTIMGGGTGYQSLASGFQLKRGDYAEVLVYQNSGGALDLTGGGVDTPGFGIIYLGGLGSGPGVP